MRHAAQGQDSRGRPARLGGGGTAPAPVDEFAVAPGEVLPPLASGWVRVAVTAVSPTRFLARDGPGATWSPEWSEGRWRWDGLSSRTRNLGGAPGVSKA